MTDPRKYDELEGGEAADHRQGGDDERGSLSGQLGKLHQPTLVPVPVAAGAGAVDDGVVGDVDVDDGVVDDGVVGDGVVDDGVVDDGVVAVPGTGGA